MAQEHVSSISTPSRFLFECGEWGFTPSFGMASEVNPFEAQMRRQEDSPLTPPKSPPSESQTLPSHTISHTKRKAADKEEKHTSGRKRRIVFDGDDAEEERKKFLERNRIAASKCRQKKRKWVQELEQRAEQVSVRNRELTALVSQLRDETLYLRDQLLAHGNCDCSVVQTYLQRTSAQLTSNPSSSASASAAAAAAAAAAVNPKTSSPMSSSTPYSSTVSSYALAATSSVAPPTIST